MSPRRCAFSRCRKPLTAEETHPSGMCNACIASARTIRRGWGVPTPVNAADKKRQDEELRNQLAQETEADELYAENYRKEMRAAREEEWQRESAGKWPLSMPTTEET